MKAVCEVCFHYCQIEEGRKGLCQARGNNRGKIVSENYGRITSMALDPIEKKPLRRFYPGSTILSVGSYGCNLRCPFCQNHQISMGDSRHRDTTFVSPEKLAQLAARYVGQGNIGVAYTYNEPLIGYEYIRDCAAQVKERKLQNVVVTNGAFSLKVLKELAFYIDAWNIDLKGFTNQFYEKIGGDLETVKTFIMEASKTSHVEVTTLMIPGENDNEGEIGALANWLASVNPDIVLHITRFFPCYHMQDKKAAKVEDVYRFAEIARGSLRHVYVGNC